MDWQALRRMELPAPYVPKISSPTDTSNFELLVDDEDEADDDEDEDDSESDGISLFSPSSLSVLFQAGKLGISFTESEEGEAIVKRVAEESQAAMGG
jgi:hypothetical protein